ncbi:phosphoribosyltransferase [Thiohalorhabdus denitrificans]|uniref:Predicted phosphoribosyltransferase n=1 Tax=Thiohalorhabdus denitrificans TaxID=381306 RepID=A0A0P9CJR1_9GAMM|nr:phosphoribosyltransferase family protein [Thiohalorhabdus denitrificans]KPV39119.1 phosphoribosyltransferase [Thiohalorhabdus denitrificans]SCX77181.1 Predicted phosphoribosyltransferase [Thiohalorhabdus denitrificans]
MFQDRKKAGERLAALLQERGIRGDIVLAVPRGGLPVGRAVADALGLPLDIVVARKMGAPGNPELAVGAVASDGSVWRNESLIRQLGVDEAYLEEARRREAANAREKFDRYRGGRPDPDLKGRTVLIVDDGVATGATTVACIRQAYSRGAARVVLAVPVAPPESVRRLEGEADEVVAVETPEWFMAVGQFYAEFGQVSDEEAMRYLTPGKDLPGGPEEGS